MDLDRFYWDNLKDFLNYINPECRDWARNYLGTEVTKKRYINILREIEQVPYSMICDVGAFPFYLDYLISKIYKDIKIDCFDINIDRINKDVFTRTENLNTYNHNIEVDGQIPGDRKYDIILFLEVFEHLRFDPINLFESLKRLMNGNSRIFIQIPNLYYWKSLLRFIGGRGILDYYTEYKKLTLYGHMGHVRLPSKYEMVSFIENVGMEIAQIVNNAGKRTRKNATYLFGESHLLYIAQLKQ